MCFVRVRVRVRVRAGVRVKARARARARASGRARARARARVRVSVSVRVRVRTPDANLYSSLDSSRNCNLECNDSPTCLQSTPNLYIVILASCWTVFGMMEIIQVGSTEAAP